MPTTDAQFKAIWARVVPALPEVTDQVLSNMKDWHQAGVAPVDENGDPRASTPDDLLRIAFSPLERNTLGHLTGKVDIKLDDIRAPEIR